jgi:phage terminase small subunit
LWHEAVAIVRACECIDTITAARASMAKTGPIIRNQYGIEKLHPAVAVEKTAPDGLYTALRMLEINARVVGTREDPPWVD